MRVFPARRQRSARRAGEVGGTPGGGGGCFATPCAAWHAQRRRRHTRRWLQPPPARCGDNRCAWSGGVHTDDVRSGKGGRCAGLVSARLCSVLLPAKRCASFSDGQHCSGRATHVERHSGRVGRPWWRAERTLEGGRRLCLLRDAARGSQRCVIPRLAGGACTHVSPGRRARRCIPRVGVKRLWLPCSRGPSVVVARSPPPRLLLHTLTDPPTPLPRLCLSDAAVLGGRGEAVWRFQPRGRNSRL